MENEFWGRPATVKRKADLLMRIGNYVQKNLKRKITLQEVAEQFDISVSTITQVFQKQGRTTFHRYVTGVRMQAALELMKTGMPLEQVGKEVGYQDHSSFYRAFRQTYGVSPREYRMGKEQ